MANYLLRPVDEAEKKEQKRKIISDNRRTTINKYEISYEGLSTNLASGEDGINNLIGDTRLKVKLNPRRPISQHDIDTIPPLKTLREDREFWLQQMKTATGMRAYHIKQILIEIGKNQYVVRDSYNPPIAFNSVTPNKYVCRIYDDFWMDEEGGTHFSGISLCDSKVCSAILCNYSRLKEDGWGEFEGDLYYLMDAFDLYCGEALKGEPILEQIVIDKIDGMQNDDIQHDLYKKFGTSYSTEYISSLYRNKIPKLIASCAEDSYIQDWYLNHEKGAYKRCSRCGSIKLAHSKYFSKNSTSNDGFYSICKACRNKSGNKD